MVRHDYGKSSCRRRVRVQAEKEKRYGGMDKALKGMNYAK